MAKSKKVEVVKVEDLKVVASFSVKRAGDMTKEQRKEVATWLKAEAAKLTKFGKDYSKRFTVRLFR